MRVESFKPRSKELQKCIECFYSLDHSSDEGPVSYLTFPSHFSIVACVLNAENIVSQEKVITRPLNTTALATSLVCRFNKPIRFQYEGDIREFCIYFKPLGLNAFLDDPLATYSTSNFDAFVPFPDYVPSMRSIFAMDSCQFAALEEYWLSKLRGFSHELLQPVVGSLLADPRQSTAQLALASGVSQRTLIKHFKMHLCKTPSEFRKILRFRNTLSEHKKNAPGNLTELSHVADFFDQSHMISDFRSLTGHTPRSFFKQLSRLEDDKINWIFL